MAMFEQTRSWVDHEMAQHRRSWFCILCKFSSDQQSEVTLHLERHHPDTLGEESAHTMTYMTSRPLDSIDASTCPLCDWDKVLLSKSSVTTVSRESFMSHLAHHLEQLALFAIPRVGFGDNSDSLESNLAANRGSQPSQSTENPHLMGQEPSIEMTATTKEDPAEVAGPPLQRALDSQAASFTAISLAFPSQPQDHDTTMAWMTRTEPHDPDAVTAPHERPESEVHQTCNVPSIASADLPDDATVQLSELEAGVASSANSSEPVLRDASSLLFNSLNDQQSSDDKIATWIEGVHPDVTDASSCSTPSSLERNAHEKEAAWLAELPSKLWYPGMKEREQSIPLPLATTFDWVYGESGLQRWLFSGNSIFWIAGKPGSGKTTLMRKLAFDFRTETHPLRGWIDARAPYILSFYIHGTGSTLQKSVVGLLRYLIHRLIEKGTFWIVAKSADKIGSYDNWTTDDLSSALKEALRSLPPRSVVLLVDGLDECKSSPDELELVDLLDLLVELQTLDSVKLCVASRAWPIFLDRLGKPPSLLLDDINAGDILTFVRVRLALWNGETLGDLARTLVERSEGSFLEAARLLDGLKSALEAGADEKALERQLNELPIHQTQDSQD